MTLAKKFVYKHVMHFRISLKICILWNRDENLYIAELNFGINYRGQILHVTSPETGSDDKSLDQSEMSIQILPQSRDTFLIKLRLYT